MTMPLGPALLFCPADRPDRYAKAAATADAVILDLEDAVAPARKAAARESLTSVPLDPAATIVRVNAAATEDFAADLAALAATDYRHVMLAKAETTSGLEALGAYRVVALCESPLGVEHAALLAAAPNVSALMWGAEDLVAALGGSGSRRADGGHPGAARLPRAPALLAAGAAGYVGCPAVHRCPAQAAGPAAAAAVPPAARLSGS